MMLPPLMLIEETTLLYDQLVAFETSRDVRKRLLILNRYDEAGLISPEEHNVECPL